MKTSYKKPIIMALTALLAAGTATAQDPPANLPPVLELGDDITVTAGGEFTRVTLTPVTASDPDGDALLITYAWSLPLETTATFDGTPDTPSVTGLFPVGDTLVTLTITDEDGATATDTVLVSVQLPAPPAISCSVNPQILWPPNHKMREVTISVEATSTAVSSPSDLVITALVSSNEPDQAVPGDRSGDVHGYDGHTAPAAFDLEYDAGSGLFARSLQLRSERLGSGEGRHYTIVTSVTDPFGQTAEDTCIVFVPHNRSQAFPALADQAQEAQAQRQLKKKQQKKKQQKRQRKNNRAGR